MGPCRPRVVLTVGGPCRPYMRVLVEPGPCRPFCLGPCWPFLFCVLVDPKPSISQDLLARKQLMKLLYFVKYFIKTVSKILSTRAAEIGVRAFVRTPNGYKKKSSYKVFLKYVRWRTSRWTSKSSLRIPCVHVQNQYLSTLLSIQIDCHLFVVVVSFSGPVRRSIGPGQTANLLYKLYYFLRFCGKCVQVNIFFEHVF